MLIYLHGSDSFLAREAIKSIKAKYLAKNPTGTELVEINAGDELPNFADLKTIPLFATSRLIFIKRAGELLVHDQTNLASMLTDLPITTVVVLWDAKPLKPASSLSDISNKAAKRIDVNPLIGGKLTSWVKKQAESYDINPTPILIADLTRQYGSNLWAIETDLATRFNSQSAISDWSQNSIEKPFAVFDDVRRQDWLAVKKRIINNFNQGEATELIIGGLASAVRQSVRGQTERKQIIDALSDVDLALKTGLIEAGDAIALLAHYLSAGQNRLQWEELYYVVN